MRGLHQHDTSVGDKEDWSLINPGTGRHGHLDVAGFAEVFQTGCFPACDVAFNADLETEKKLQRMFVILLGKRSQNWP